MRRLLLCILLFGFCVFCVFAQGEKKTKVAVMPPSASGEAQGSTAQGLTSIIVTELSLSPNLQVTDRRDVEKVLKEQALSQSGYCEQSCQIEIGKILQSKWVVTGDLNKLGKLFILTLKVLNVETGQVEYQDQEKHTGEVEGLAETATTLSARLRDFLQGGKPTDTPPDHEKPEPPKGFGTLKVTTTPPGATVILEAENKGRTPLTLSVPVGKHDLTLSLSGYEDIPKVITIEKEKTLEITEEFSLQTGTISVNSTPSDASVYLNNTYQGKTPLELKRVSVGTHLVRVALSDYELKESSVDVKYKDAAQLNFNLKGLPGKLAITSTPQGATVYVDGKSAGKTPLSGYAINPGTHTIKVSLSGYKTQTETLEILPNQPRTLNFSLEPGLTTPVTKGNKAGLDDMVLIPAGEFIMGSNDGQDDEKPPHKVYLDAYYIDKYEVTNAKYKACVKAGACKPPHNAAYYNIQEFSNHPVVYVDWHQADAYCKWAGKQLPTEAEWEKAARGENSLKYPFGNTWDESKCNNWNYSGPLTSKMANMSSNRGTTPVGAFKDCVSPYGVYDMAGNVWEWVEDWYDANYYENSPENNPKGPTTGTDKALRGGSWSYDDEYYLRGADRLRYVPGIRDYFRGFRCAANTK